MAGLWSVRQCGPVRTVHGLSPRAPARVAVRPSVRSSPATGGAVPWLLRGSARCTGSSGLGDTATFIPAGGGPVREAMPASRTVRACAPPRAPQSCTERAQTPDTVFYLAENRPLPDGANCRRDHPT
ncbi:hypothetical protein GCM10010206_22300 [Streptomyces cinerochromogenes]|nr:hypothetical protein GCM10010206_22300 [Streptomyces cinerochromogenes]